jgi:DNA uptake protein ComE-like DNA-binding protein
MKAKKKSSVLPHKQKQGIFLLLGIGLGILATIIILVFLNKDNKLLTLKENEISHKTTTYNKHYYKNNSTNYKPENQRKHHPFHFNPNNVKKEELIKFGLTEKQASNLVNYVKAGGKFKKKEDLKRLYCMSDYLYNQVSPYIIIPQTNEIKSQEAFKSNPNNNTLLFTKPILIFDLNQADTLDLQALRGIGPSYARRIYNYGKSLGGYVSLEQLKEVYGMNDTLYQKIIPFLKLEKIEPKKININTATIKELSNHPYIDFYLAKAIIKLRQEITTYKTLDQIRQVHLLDEKTYEKLLPYLEL